VKVGTYQKQPKTSFMKHLCFLLYLFFCLQAIGQVDSSSKLTSKHKFYQAKVLTTDSAIQRGLWYSVNEENIGLIQVGNKNISYSKKYLPDPANYRQYAIENIKEITLQRQNAVARNALIGAGVGLAVGVIIGFISGDDKEEAYTGGWDDIGRAVNNALAMSAGEKALAGGLGGAAAGGIVGLIIGASSKKKFNINGKKENFNAARPTLLQMAYSKKP
jgi:hypothetical protein